MPFIYNFIYFLSLKSKLKLILKNKKIKNTIKNYSYKLKITMTFIRVKILQNQILFSFC